MIKKKVEKFVEFCSTNFGKKLMNREAELISEKLSDCGKTLSIGCGIGSIGIHKSGRVRIVGKRGGI